MFIVLTRMDQEYINRKNK